MKITDVSVELASKVRPDVWPWRDGLPRRPSATTAGYLRVETDEGIVGRAATTDVEHLRTLVRGHFRDELVGHDPLAREYLWARVWEVNRLAYMSTTAVGLVDIALWDIAGKAAGLPVYKLAGYARERLPAYASTIAFSSVEEYLDVADQCLELGFTAIKLHAWGDARRDARLSEALRSHVGPDIALMFDGSAGWDLADAIYVGRALSDADFLWYEEPMKEFSVNSYATLAERVDVPLLVAEVTEGAHWNTADYITASRPSYVRTSSGFKAGITGALRVAHLAEAFQIRAEVHGSGLANEHLCMSIPNTTYYESLVTSNPVRPDPRLNDRAELVASPAPGLGWESLEVSGFTASVA